MEQRGKHKYPSCFHEGYLVFGLSIQWEIVHLSPLTCQLLFFEWSKRFEASALQFVHRHSGLEPASSTVQGEDRAGLLALAAIRRHIYRVTFYPNILTYPGTSFPEPTISCLLFSHAPLPPPSHVGGFASRCSSPLAIAVGVASLARSSSPAPTYAFVAFWPIGLSVRATRSFSIFSRVVRVSSSTSAALRWAVGIGGSTITSRSATLVHFSPRSPQAKW